MAPVTRSRRRDLAILALAAALLTAVWRTLPPSSPPLYDGLCIVNPFQYASPPPGASGPRATDAAKTLDVSGGQPGTELITGETPPQATLDLGEGVLDIPPGVSSVRITIRPVPPPATPPVDGHIDGNVYRVEVRTPQGAAVNLLAGRKAEVLIRPSGGSATAPRAIEHLSGDHWDRLDTSTMNCAETQAAVTTSLGDFAIVIPGAPGASPPPDSGAGVPTGPVVVGAIVLILAAIIALIRLRRARSGP